MNKNVKSLLDIALYLIMFFLIQFVSMCLAFVVWALISKVGLSGMNNETIGNAVATNPMLMIIVSSVGSVITIALFAWRKWTPITRTYLKSAPWVSLIWIVLMSLGTIIPSTWLDEQMKFTMPDEMQRMLECLMGEHWGYIAIGLLAPIAEEVVFRGAILRTLLKCLDQRMHWVAIVISALLFGMVHGNMPQFIHGAALGLLLGWMYYRTGSIVPGIVLHWVNNTVAFVAYHLLPGAADAKLIDIFGGNERVVWLSILFSLCIFLPSLYQLTIRLKKNN